ncbi:hypothetical protein DFH06DRAFT_521072 [Mycena polygramma]|nr:hypothetical protein DFH06DRAFT_521072 [Mycena polygramma]
MTLRPSSPQPRRRQYLERPCRSIRPSPCLPPISRLQEGNNRFHPVSQGAKPKEYAHRDPISPSLFWLFVLSQTPGCSTTGRQYSPARHSRRYAIILPAWPRPRLSLGLPWQLLLLQLASQKLCTRICDQLILENLVSSEQLAKCRAITFNRLFPSLTLFRLDQPFPVNFGSPVVLVFVGQALHRLELRSIFHASKNSVQYAPWAGSAIARFDLSTDTGRRVVHLRILEITTPVSCTVKNYDGRLLQPKAGQLLTVRSPESGGSEAPWKCDIDARDSAPSLALRALWDASADAGYLAPLSD